MQVREGLLFVWPSSGPQAFVHSAAAQPAGSQVFAQVSSGTLQPVPVQELCQLRRANGQAVLVPLHLQAVPRTLSLVLLSAADVTAQHTMYFQRDFPVPYDIVVENIGDQSHVPFAHHGVAGNRWATYLTSMPCSY